MEKVRTCVDCPFLKQGSVASLTEVIPRSMLPRDFYNTITLAEPLQTGYLALVHLVHQPFAKQCSWFLHLAGQLSSSAHFTVCYFVRFPQAFRHAFYIYIQYTLVVLGITQINLATTAKFGEIGRVQLILEMCFFFFCVSAAFNQRFPLKIAVNGIG